MKSITENYKLASRDAITGKKKELVDTCKDARNNGDEQHTTYSSLLS